MKARVLKGSKQEIADNVLRLPGEVREAIVFVEESSEVTEKQIAGDIFAVLAELDGQALERRGVQALEKTFDDELGAQIEPADLADDFGAQVFFGAHGD